MGRAIERRTKALHERHRAALSPGNAVLAGPAPQQCKDRAHENSEHLPQEESRSSDLDAINLPNRAILDKGHPQQSLSFPQV